MRGGKCRGREVQHEEMKNSLPEELSFLIIISQLLFCLLLYTYTLMISAALYTRLECFWLGGNLDRMERTLALASGASSGSRVTV